MFLGLLAGCQGPAVTFPAKPAVQSEQMAGYDLNHDGKADYFLLTGPDGRIDRIGYDVRGTGQPDQIIHLDSLDNRKCRHLVLILDGIPHDVLEEFYRQGHLRMFYAPATVIPPYPVMTDLALEDALLYMPCLGTEAAYYDWTTHRQAGGTGDYLAGRNEPFAKMLSYRASTMDDAFSYLSPGKIFHKEIQNAKRAWDKRQQAEEIAYFVSCAALGSRLGKAGQIQALTECEQLANQIVYESHGLVRVTLMADHGQTNVPCVAVKLEEPLRRAGWRITKTLTQDKDVVMPRFGLVTVVAMNTRRPAELAKDLIGMEPVTLVSYPQGDAVVVMDKTGKAEIHSTDGKTFEYCPMGGDPLKLAGLAKGPVDGREIFKATSDGKHPYPDALYRLWRAHFALMNNPPTVLACLDDRYYSGSGFFAGMVSMASTHGGLNWGNSAMFIMSTAGPIAGPLRSEDIPAAIGGLFNLPFPRRW